MGFFREIIILVLYTIVMHDQHNDSDPKVRRMNALEFSDKSSFELFEKTANGNQISAVERVSAIRDLLALSSLDWGQRKELWDIWEAAFGKNESEDDEGDKPKLTEDEATGRLMDVQDVLNRLPENFSNIMEINQMKQLAFSGRNNA